MTKADVYYQRLWNGYNSRTVLHLRDLSVLLSWTNDIISVHFIPVFLCAFIIIIIIDLLGLAARSWINI